MKIFCHWKEHLDEGRWCSHSAVRFGFRKEVDAVFLVVTQLNGGEGGREEPGLK